MLFKKFGLTAGALAFAAFGFAASAQAGPLTNVDVKDGGGTTLASDVSEFDWSSSGSGVAVGIGPFGTPLAVGQTFDFKYQSFLSSFVTSNTVTNNPVTTGIGGAFAGTEYEFTAAAAFTEIVTGVAVVGPNVVATFDAANSLGSFSIYYDDIGAGGQKANVAAGTGFDDGIEVARFSVIAVPSTFTANSGTTGNGTATLTGVLQLVLDFVDPNYIVGLDGKIFDLEFQSNQQFPAGTSATTAFHQSSPTSGTDYAPVVVGANDIVFKVDGSNTFSIPEPQTLLLFGIGLVMFGFMARRGSRQR